MHAGAMYEYTTSKPKKTAGDNIETAFFYFSSHEDQDWDRDWDCLFLPRLPKRSSIIAFCWAIFWKNWSALFFRWQSPSLPRSLQIWVSMKSSISQLTFFSFYNNTSNSLPHAPEEKNEPSLFPLPLDYLLYTITTTLQWSATVEWPRYIERGRKVRCWLGGQLLFSWIGFSFCIRPHIRKRNGGKGCRVSLWGDDSRSYNAPGLILTFLR